MSLLVNIPRAEQVRYLLTASWVKALLRSERFSTPCVETPPSSCPSPSSSGPTLQPSLTPSPETKTELPPR